MAWSEIITFTFVATLLVISPGPNGVLIAKTVPTSGRTAGFANVLGFITAFYVHGALSILGISLLLVQSAFAFTLIKYVGAAYLCWLGLKSLIEAYKGIAPVINITPARQKRTLFKDYLEGLLTNVLNPKVSMFYLAAFPQFITPGETAFSTSFLLIFIHSTLNAIWFGLMVILFSGLTQFARNGNFQRWLKGITGTVFIGFGIKLASFRP